MSALQSDSEIVHFPLKNQVLNNKSEFLIPKALLYKHVCF